MLRIICILLLTLFTHGSAIEQNRPATEIVIDSQEGGELMETAPPLPSYAATFVRMLLSLLAILLLLFFTMWGLRKINATRYLQGGALGAIKLIESRAISQKTVLHLVEISGVRVMIAESQAEVRKIHTVGSSTDPQG